MYHLVFSKETKQTGKEECFVGGKPKLPPELTIPLCTLCGKEQDFFLQIAFPEHHPWAGLTLAIFACTRCADSNYLIPEMLIGPLKGGNIPKNFLSKYQRNFRFEIFRTVECQLINNYKERVKFRALFLQNSGLSHTNTGVLFGVVGGSPQWILEDESPQFYDFSTPMCFLFQIYQGIQFETVSGALPQIELGLDGTPEPSRADYYHLFIGNAVYFFGTVNTTFKMVYAITQVD